MEYGRRFRILKTNKEVVEGELIQTKGDDANYPTFLLADGTRLGVHHSAVLARVDDDCGPQGIKRPTSKEITNYLLTGDKGEDARYEGLVIEDENLNKRILPG
jgi:hypothetical protein